MEFRKNLQIVKDMAVEDDVEHFLPTEAKLAINEVLHQFMPPKTTLKEVEELALAIFKTIQDAWEN